MLDGDVGEFERFGATGWAADRADLSATLSVDILKNGKRIARVPAAGFRPDLEAAGLGDGRKGFWFNPLDFLDAKPTRFEVVFAGTKKRLQRGLIALKPEVPNALHAPSADVASSSKTRWRGVEPDTGLTWGRLMSGDTFFDAVVQHVGTAGFAEKSILEVGPGYGRLLKTLRARGYGYKSYVGLDLSAERVQRLNGELGDARTRFVCGDAMSDVAGSGFDLFLCSSTFEHLYPNFVPALTNLRTQMSSDATLCIDFAQRDPDMLHSLAFFEEPSGVFVRYYARWELERMLELCGLRVQGISSIALGVSVTEEVVRRIFVCARTSRGNATAGAAGTA